ncbi:MAG: single-stranded-DNA-specific exonuclease RecJ [Armatimonadota bacterium]|nr:MAG: single-stranded-DNA-specific exonuclease RecJ [Armatimonadota bacterium]
MRHSILGASWRNLTADPEHCACLTRELNLQPVVAHVLAARGITAASDAGEYLHGSLDDLHDPLVMRDMPEAVACLRRAVEAGGLIRVCGDYDADGVTATALLVRALRALGATVDYYLPHRVADGYGLNIPAIEQAAQDGVRLLLTVDCGVSAFDQLRRAQELGLEVIVSDHHEPPAELPPAAAILNPKRGDCAYPFKDLSGVGVAYKLLHALAADMKLRRGAERAFLDLVAIGTVADVVGLTGENRILVKHGLSALNQTRKHGVQALLRAASISPPVTSYNVAFGLAPRLNAAGRLDHAQAAAVLLMTSDPAEASNLAEHVCSLNTQRRDEERRILQSAEEMIRSSADLDRERMILLAAEGWHAGVIGIVASRLVERHYRPVVLVAIADGFARGSARSIPGFHICDALANCSSLLEEFGGHELAAGFSIAPDNIEALRSKLAAQAVEALRPEDLVRVMTIDAWADLSGLSLEAVEGINAMAPFGAGNPQPVIGLRNLTVESVDTCGAEGRHLRLVLREGDVATGAIWFSFGHVVAHLPPGTVVDACCLPEIDEWGGSRSVRLKLRDLALDQPLSDGPAATAAT